MDTKNEALPVNPGTYTLPGNGQTPPQLLGGFCDVCQAFYYPMPKYCPNCVGKTLKRTVGNRGRVYSLTIIRVKPPFGLPQPYSVGYVDLDQTGLRVFALFDPQQINEIKLGDPVGLTVRQLGHDGCGAPRLRPVFTLLTQGREA